MIDASPTVPSVPRRRPRRRRALWWACACLAVLAMPLLGGSCIVRRLGGNFTHAPGEMAEKLSPGAKALVARAFEDLPSERLFDYHVHVVGLGSGGTGVEVNPEMRTWLHPIKRVQFAVYMSACGVDDPDHADQQAFARFLELSNAYEAGALFALLAFDRNYSADGTPNAEATTFHVPNDYVFALAERHPERFRPVASVHPYRKDALAELDRCAARGARLVKWLPNAMGIDPASPACDAFYDRMRDLGMALLSHTGAEHAVDSSEAQAFGNPLRLRRALDRGVRVIAAHCASEGTDADLDRPGAPVVPSFELFIRLMDEKRYEGHLFGEISGLTQWTRFPNALETLLARTDLHGRLVNGSDYPIPALNCVISTDDLRDAGFISTEERKWLREIYGFNPLVFDIVLKRTLRHPRTGQGFPASVFLRHASL